MNQTDDSPKFIGKPSSLFYCHMTGDKKGYAQADEAIQMEWRIANGIRFNNNRKAAPMLAFDESHRAWVSGGRE